MFGMIRPCRNRLGADLRAAWMAHLCGMCLALRDEHGHLARLVTNYDAVVVSALVEAQTGTDGHRRDAGPCALRGMKGASVADGGGARLAASVSLLLAAAKLRDHVDDGDVEGRLRARATRTLAARWEQAGSDTGGAIALDTRALLDVVGTQREREAAPGSILDVTRPAEDATALAFRHTAVVAGRPGNADALAEAGRLFGRLAHLLDAVEDLHDDHASGAWNPIVALGLAPAEVRTLCDDALLGVKLALRDAEFVDKRLVHVLLVHELGSAVDRAFTKAGHPPPGPPRGPAPWPPGPPPLTPPLPPNQQPPGGPPPPGWNQPPPPGWGPPGPPNRPPDQRRNRGPVGACLGWLVVCGTCQICCADEWTHPCTGEQHQGKCKDGCDWCECGCDCCDGCGDCCDCCSCCDC